MQERRARQLPRCGSGIHDHERRQHARHPRMKEMKRSIMPMRKNLDTTALALSRHQGRDRQPPNLQISTFVNGERRQFAKGPNDS